MVHIFLKRPGWPIFNGSKSNVWIHAVSTNIIETSAGRVRLVFPNRLGSFFCLLFASLRSLLKLARDRTISWTPHQQTTATLREEITQKTRLVCASVACARSVYIDTYHSVAVLSRVVVGGSVTRLGDLLDFGQLFKAFGNN